MHLGVRHADKIDRKSIAEGGDIQWKDIINRDIKHSNRRWEYHAELRNSAILAISQVLLLPDTDTLGVQTRV